MDMRGHPQEKYWNNILKFLAWDRYFFNELLNFVPDTVNFLIACIKLFTLKSGFWIKKTHNMIPQI